MTDYYVLVRSRHGRLRYRPGAGSSDDSAAGSGLFSQIQPRYLRPSIVCVSRVSAVDRDSLNPGHGRPPLLSSHSSSSRLKPSRTRVVLSSKLAGPRDNAFRFIRSVISAKADSTSTSTAAGKRRRQASGGDGVDTTTEQMHAVDVLRGGHRGSTSTISRQTYLHDSGSDLNLAKAPTTRTIRAGSTTSLSLEDKPLASGNGVVVNIQLAEPTLFLQGYDQAETSNRSTTMLRGSLVLKVQKSAKLKAVTLRFRGTAVTKWPEGIPPRKSEFEETGTLMSHTWPFFNAQFPNADRGSGADRVKMFAAGKQDGSPYMSGSPMSSSLNVNSARDAKRMSLGNIQSRSFDKSESRSVPTVAQKGYRMFHPGEYVYNFELPLDSRLPETIDVELGSVKYELEASIERAGAFKANLIGVKEVTLIRAPSEGSLEQVEPIAISRTWEDQLHYDIVISGKSFPLGSRIPIALKLTPLAKVQCHRVKVFITENIEYFCSNKRVHRMEPTKKVLLYEKKADGSVTSTFPGSTARIVSGGGVPYAQRAAAARGEAVTPADPTNMLGRLDSDAAVGPTELELQVQLPSCKEAVLETGRPNLLHFDTTYQNIQVHHWIKIVMRLSRPDTEDPTKRRHFEISIDSPFHILSCRASQANTSLPAYTLPDTAAGHGESHAACGCPGAPVRRVSSSLVSAGGDAADDAAATEEDLPMRPHLARPPTAHVHGAPMSNGHVQRPMHMLRVPSFAPPGFEDEQPPPALATPPPEYDDIASPTAGHGLADYFSRFNALYPGADDADADDTSDPDDDDRASVRGRVNLPLTPGGRIARSADSRFRRRWAEAAAAQASPSIAAALASPSIAAALASPVPIAASAPASDSPETSPRSSIAAPAPPSRDDSTTPVPRAA